MTAFVLREKEPNFEVDGLSTEGECDEKHNFGSQPKKDVPSYR